MNNKRSSGFSISCICASMELFMMIISAPSAFAATFNASENLLPVCIDGSSTLATYNTGFSVSKKRSPTATLFSFFKMFFATDQHFQFSFQFRIYTSQLFSFLDLPFYTIKVFQLKFGINNFFITDRINCAFLTQYIFIFKTADHMNDRIHFTNIS